MCTDRTWINSRSFTCWICTPSEANFVWINSLSVNTQTWTKPSGLGSVIRRRFNGSSSPGAKKPFTERK